MSSYSNSTPARNSNVAEQIDRLIMERIAKALEPEKQELASDSFKYALDAAYRDAEQLWAPQRRGENMRDGMATITGSVNQQSPFSMRIDEHEYLVLAGLRTQYNADDTCKFIIIEDGIMSAPYIVDSSTRYLMFINKIIWRPEKQFRIEMQQGNGVLRFVCIGATIYQQGWRGWSSPAYSVIGDKQGDKLNEPVRHVEETNIRTKQMIDSLEEPKP